MVKCRATGPDGELILAFGLSRANVERLTAGQPIRIRGAEIGLPKLSMMIFFGETEREMDTMLRAHRLIGPETVVNEEPK